MTNDKVLYSLVGFVIGALVAGFFATYAVNGQHNGMMRMMGMHTNNQADNMMSNGSDHMSSMMGNMSVGLSNKSGDDFDKAFISEMVIHHQGAIDMANLALARAKHQEVKDLARAIIEAQAQEISQMESWRNTWYK